MLHLPLRPAGFTSWFILFREEGGGIAALSVLLRARGNTSTIPEGEGEEEEEEGEHCRRTTLAR